MPRGCATTVSSRPLGTGSGARGSLPRPQRLQHAQNCIEMLMFRTRSGSQINQYTATSARKSAKKASSDLRASTPERIDQVHHAHRKNEQKSGKNPPFLLKSGISFFLLIPELQTYKKCADYKRNRKKRPKFFFLLCAPLNFYFLSLMNYCFDLIS